MKTVLIANRGEIAVRIIRTCKKIGVKSVAVYSESDEGSMHTRLADESICIGPRAADKSYLNIESIIAAAKAADANLIHPGFGFLSENAAFRQACDEEGLKFIGPSADSMILMGDKQKAREVIAEGGFPVVPGSDGCVETLEEAVAVAKKTGYPLMIKAVSGGGGRGIRIVNDEQELINLFSITCREAEVSFGDRRVYLESYLPKARHIEVQVLADEYGNAIHLGTRECTLQRKNQKIIEEAPASNVDPAVISAIQETSVNIVKKLGYFNAGTIEYLLTEDGRFYFMEMNTRIQVEHPVTECIYGVDLVKAQIHVALSHKLSINQKDIVPKGHAIECRINAEDPAKSFMPSPGIITEMVLPGGNGIRVDTGFCAGDEITPFYDSMIMKIICMGDDRQEAIRAARCALEELKIAGINTSTSFSKAILEDRDFIEGRIHTKWIEQVFIDRFMRSEQ